MRAPVIAFVRRISAFGRKMHPGLAALAEDQASSSAGAMLAKLKSLITNREEIRMAIGKQTILARSFFAPTAFSKPESRDIWLQRVRANFAHYRSIYAILFAAVAVYTVLSSPWLLFGLSVIGGAFAYAFVLNSPETPITIAGFELKRREKMLALAPFSLLIIVICGLSAFCSFFIPLSFSRTLTRLFIRACTRSQLAHLRDLCHGPPRAAPRLLPRGRRTRRLGRAGAGGPPVRHTDRRMSSSGCGLSPDERAAVSLERRRARASGDKARRDARG